MKRGGFRADWVASGRDNLITLQGDVYDGFINQVITPLGTNIAYSDKTDLSGFNILCRWQQNLANSNLILQAYYDHTERQELALGEKRNTFDIDFQYKLQHHENQEFIWGLAYRYTADDIKNSQTWNYDPKKRQDNLFSAFVQSEFKISLSPLIQGEENSLRLMLGSKFEQNDYSGFEYQPSARLLWIPNDRHSIWAAISRAVRTPSRTDVDASHTIQFNVKQKPLSLPPFAPKTILGVGNENFKSETLLAYELGYRFKPTSHLLLDTTIFFNSYNHLRSVDFNLTPTGILLKNTNKMWGEIYGLEMAASWQIFDTWKLIGSYSYLNINLHLPPNILTFFGETGEGDSPHNQANLRSLLTLPHNIELDTALYYVDNVPNQNAASYTRFDVRLGWQAGKNLKLSLGARNLFDRQHSEFGNGFSGNMIILADEVRRAFYLQLQYRF
jgi:iron complex outermembrane receptor protein